MVVVVVVVVVVVAVAFAFIRATPTRFGESGQGQPRHRCCTASIRWANSLMLTMLIIIWSIAEPPTCALRAWLF